jgi:CheY-like chemotaxis protein/DNA-binding CsgD family transcriptional regulator
MDLLDQFGKLTSREREIVYLLINTDDEGYSLALSLGITEQTLRQHTTHIYAKLQVASRLELITQLRCHFCNNQKCRKIALIIDDDENWLLIVQNYLEVFNLEIKTANRGKTALKIIKDNPPDLVILDLMMPDVDGYQVLEHMRIDPQLQNIPVIIITAKDIEEKDIELGLPLLLKGEQFEQELVDSVLKKIKDVIKDSPQG